LPNRVALLSENSPPPRNPQIAYCVDQYVSNQISINGDIIIAGAETANKIDLSVLPKKLLKNTSKSFANVNLAIDQLRSAELITEELAQASINFRPLHQSVRSIERNIRSYEEEIKHIKSDMKNLEEGGELRPLEEKITRLEKEKEALIASIPENWNEELKTFRNLQKAEQSAYRKYTKSAQAAYQPIANMNVILEANSDYFILEEELLATKTQVENLTPEEMIEPLGSLGKRFSKVAGAEKIKSAISKARRALKSRNPSKEKAQKQLDKAIKLYSEQVEWRTDAAVNILPKLITYEDLMRETIGIRDQAKLTKQQALFVAKCQANHRDVSLNF
jgi:hypothetical protein